MEFHLDKGKLLKSEKTPEGYLRCYARIARTGELKYFNADGSERIEVVSPEVLFDKGSVDSFKMKSVTDEHPPVVLDASNTYQYQKGMTSNLAVVDGDFLGIALTVTDEGLIKKILRGDAEEISCGYFTETRLRADGKFEQLYRKGNHVAVVRKGRAGDKVKIKLDSEDSSDTYSDIWQSEESQGFFEKPNEKIICDTFDKFKEDNSGKNIKSSYTKTFMKKIILDGEILELEDPSLASHVKKIDTELKTLRGDAAEKAKFKADAESQIEALKIEIETLKKDAANLQGKADGLESEKEELKNKISELETAKPEEVKTDSANLDISQEVMSRIEAWSEIKPYYDSLGEELTIDGKMSKIDVRKMALMKRFPKRKFDESSDDYINGCFDAVEWGTVAEAKKDAAETQEDTSKQVDVVLAGIAAGRSDNSDKVDYMAAYMRDLENNWQSK